MRDIIKWGVYLFISVYTTLSLVSPPVNKFSDYLFTSPDSKSDISLIQFEEGSTSEVTTVSNPIEVVQGDIDNLKGNKLYEALHRGRDIQTPNKEEILAGYRVSSPFGWRTHPVLGDRRFHSGVDLGMRIGTPLYNPTRLNGVVKSWSDGINGLVCDLDLKNSKGELVGIQLRYVHMSRCNVGNKKAYEKIGESGNTGRSTGPHLHLTLKVEGNVIPASRAILEALVNPRGKGL
jgi:murein DD-endopeptidase MepM/ murein hydrolase activator NlpD